AWNSEIHGQQYMAFDSTRCVLRPLRFGGRDDTARNVRLEVRCVVCVCVLLVCNAAACSAHEKHSGANMDMSSGAGSGGSGAIATGTGGKGAPDRASDASPAARTDAHVPTPSADD